MALPKEAEAGLARSLSAYIRATPARELPGDLRRWRSWRPQTIASRAHEIAARLEDEGLRAKVREWLDEKPKLAKRDAEALRLACERPDGWEEEVAALLRPQRGTKPTADPTEQLRARLEKERQKAVAARDELRAAKQAAHKAVQAEKKRADETARELERMRAELQRAHARIAELETRAAKAREADERQARREKRAADKAAADREKLSAQVRAARKEVAELRVGVRSLERDLSAALRANRAKKAGRAPAKTKTKREQLAAPSGLFDDSPETLTAWLQEEDVRLLVDGYNVSQLGFGDLALSDQRDRLRQEVARLARKHSVKATIVFDGSEVPPGTRRKPRGPVEVEYSSPDESADDHLIARLQSLPPDPVVVVTNDKELQERARAVNATIATSNQLLALLR